eukprot:CAMPEP_0172633136 /NCGR_PEP_ID=MMETSP1068-20121228/187786_1 /TAXON_ID=35684 /ORGANISM="Pseudopedinella elastica, Strain CCMP716" /LENGTH=62 /DNA_ID=CAMNT_0013444743 /DNA_START=49 /DNA_END=234 /DNA_ORIENTATION=+
MKGSIGNGSFVLLFLRLFVWPSRVQGWALDSGQRITPLRIRSELPMKETPLSFLDLPSLEAW